MTMNERLARTFHELVTPAMAEAAGADWEALPEASRIDFRIAAKKLMGMLRTPTADMLAEGNRRDLPGDAGNVWERMIFQAIYDRQD